MRDGSGPEAAASGLGNQVSLEFNLAYRWHSCIGRQDEEWTEATYRELFGKTGKDVSIPELLVGLKKWQTEMPEDPARRTFAHLERDSDGKFDDGELMNILTESIEQVAGKWCCISIYLTIDR